jgi:hypothetical protein
MARCITNRDKTLMLLGAGPGVVCAVLVLVTFLSGTPFDGWVGALVMVGVTFATFFPALANLLRMRRSR